MIKIKKQSPATIAIGLIIAAIVIRLAALPMFPLQDTSEARYGEMVRLMVETNNWITPYFDYDIPFLGKPPLFIWMAALSMKLFGINEFAVRFPALICSLGVMWLCWRLAIFQLGKTAAQLTLLILVSTAMFLVLAGTVLSDPVMLFTITLILTGFWIGWHSDTPREARRWQYLFFAGCGIAMLAKGPVAVVLAGLPIFFWCLPRGRLLLLWKKFPWILGTFLSLLIALPWYIAAELQNPGFLQYFIVGEHISRYLDSGWDGDRYGSAHIRPLGTIWIRWIQGGAPWSLVIVFIFLKQLWQRFRGSQQEISQWESFLCLWLIMPLVFFTFSKNMIWTYALPVAPAMALLLATRWHKSWLNFPKRILSTAVVVPVLMLATAVIFSQEKAGKPSQKSLITAAITEPQQTRGEIIYWKRRPFSARYYSRGQAHLLQDTSELLSLINNGKKQDFLATYEASFEQLPDIIKKRFKEIKRYRKWTLWREIP